MSEVADRGMWRVARGRWTIDLVGAYEVRGGRGSVYCDSQTDAREIAEAMRLIGDKRCVHGDVNLACRVHYGSPNTRKGKAE